MMGITRSVQWLAWIKEPIDDGFIGTAVMGQLGSPPKYQSCNCNKVRHFRSFSWSSSLSPLVLWFGLETQQTEEWSCWQPTNTSSSLHSSRTNYRIITSTLFGISNYIFDWILLLHGTTAPSLRSVGQSGFPLVAGSCPLCPSVCLTWLIVCDGDNIRGKADITRSVEVSHINWARNSMHPLHTTSTNVKHTNPQTHSHHHHLLHRTHSTSNLFMTLKLPLVIARRPNSLRLLSTPAPFPPG